jgi:butyryl-CoA dehydrogenase
MGRVVLPGPFFSTAVVAAPALADAASPALQAEWLPKIAAGRARGSLALLERSARWDAAGIAIEARPEGGGFRLSGAKLFVPDAQTADFFLVAARAPGSSGEEGLSLLLVESADPGVQTKPVQTMDQTRKLGELVLRNVTVPRSRVVGEPGQAAAILERITTRARTGLAAEMCGGAARVLDVCVEYAKVREQFGRPIGSFQGISFQLADMAVEIEAGTHLLYHAAWLKQNGRPFKKEAAMAKLFCSELAMRATTKAVQVFGGYGYTTEYPVERMMRDAKVCEIGEGTSEIQRIVIARQILGSVVD